MKVDASKDRPVVEFCCKEMFDRLTDPSSHVWKDILDVFMISDMIKISHCPFCGEEITVIHEGE